MNKLDSFFPMLATRQVNTQLSSKINNFSVDETGKKWIQTLSNSNLSPEQLEKIVNEIYSSEERRISAIESKATSLLTGIGVTISLISIILVLSGELKSFLIFPLISIGFFTWAIANLIVAAICTVNAVMIGKRHFPTIDEFENIVFVNKNNNLLEWAVNQLIKVEANLPIGWIKSNWTSSAQRHFLRSLIMIAIGFFSIIINVVLSIAYPNQLITFTETIKLQDLVNVFMNYTK